MKGGVKFLDFSLELKMIGCFSLIFDFENYLLDYLCDENDKVNLILGFKSDFKEVEKRIQRF